MVAVKRCLMIALLTMLSACVDAASIVIPEDTGAPFSFDANKTYVIWGDASPFQINSWTIWCDASGRFYHNCRAGRDSPSAVAGVHVNTYNKSKSTLLKLEDGSSAVIAEFPAGGKFFPQVRYQTSIASGGRYVKRKISAIYDIEPGKVNYVGSYTEGPGFFVAGQWIPEVMKASLKDAQNDEIAKAFVAARPTIMVLECSRNSCKYTPSEVPFPGLR